MESPTIFDYPIARRTDQFDRMGAVLEDLATAIDDLEDWAGVTTSKVTCYSMYRFPVHDQPPEQ